MSHLPLDIKLPLSFWAQKEPNTVSLLFGMQSESFSALEFECDRCESVRASSLHSLQYKSFVEVSAKS